MCAHLSHEPVTVEFDGSFTAGQMLGYLFIGLARNYQSKYLPFPFGQGNIVANIKNKGVFKKLIVRASRHRRLTWAYSRAGCVITHATLVSVSRYYCLLIHSSPTT
jgi:hypothetical protein